MIICSGEAVRTSDAEEDGSTQAKSAPSVGERNASDASVDEAASVLSR